MCGGGLCGCLDIVALRPELRGAAASRDALALADRLEELIDEQSVSPKDREAAYLAARKWPRKTAAYAYARAVLAGRLAEIKGLSGVRLIAEVERWAKRSLEQDPAFRAGAARRILGTLYVLAPASLLRDGDSEVGLELLEKQLELHPDDPVNQLRLAEGYVALGDPDPAYEFICEVVDRQKALRPSERRLLASVVQSLGGRAELGCEG
ncbi:MAG: hypothetical protein AAGA56_13795 [Myxococcota bacterium]